MIEKKPKGGGRRHGQKMIVGREGGGQKSLGDGTAERALAKVWMALRERGDMTGMMSNMVMAAGRGKVTAKMTERSQSGGST